MRAGLAGVQGTRTLMAGMQAECDNVRVGFEYRCCACGMLTHQVLALCVPEQIWGSYLRNILG